MSDGTKTPSTSCAVPHVLCCISNCFKVANWKVGPTVCELIYKPWSSSNCKGKPIVLLKTNSAVVNRWMGQRIFASCATVWESVRERKVPSIRVKCNWGKLYWIESYRWATLHQHLGKKTRFSCSWIVFLFYHTLSIITCIILSWMKSTLCFLSVLCVVFWRPNVAFKLTI